MVDEAEISDKEEVYVATEELLLRANTASEANSVGVVKEEASILI